MLIFSHVLIGFAFFNLFPLGQYSFLHNNAGLAGGVTGIILQLDIHPRGKELALELENIGLNLIR